MLRRGAPMTNNELASIQPGEVVAVRIAGVWHEGIADHDRDEHGRPWVWNKSKRTGRVEREAWDDFAGNDIHGRRLATIRVGYLGKLSPDEVIGRARARLGEEWTPIANCQRFTRACHGVPATSPEIDAIGVALLLSMLGGPLP